MLALEPGLLIAGRYRLLNPLGTGGMSQVWSARDEVLGRPVAVKVLPASSLSDWPSRDLLRREARAMAQLSHPNVASVHDYGEVEIGGAGLPFVVMELLHGNTLAAALAGGPLPWAQAVGVAAQVAAALSAAHRHGLVHCDVTPANVMLTEGGVKVLDFGIAAVLGVGQPDGRLRFGTPGYVAPERLSADEPVTPAADMYALGVLLFAALTGHRPSAAHPPASPPAHPAVHPPAHPRREMAGGEGSDQVQPSVADDARARLAAVEGLPAEVAELCLRCLAVQPADRPGSAEAAGVLAAVPGARAAAVPQAIGVILPPRTLPMPTAALPTTALPGVMPAGQAARWHLRWLAAAAGVALIAVVGFVLSIDDPAQQVQPGATTARPSATSAVAVATSGRPAPTRATTARPGTAAVANLRQLVVNGQAAGDIRAQCAESLLSRIADLQRRIDRGDTDNARQRIEQIGEEIDDRAADGDVTAQRAVTLRQALAAVVV